MELLTAIALLCQLNGSSNIYKIQIEQKKCQKELASCVLKKAANGVVSLLLCTKERD